MGRDTTLRLGGDLAKGICRVRAKFGENRTIRVTNNRELVMAALQCVLSRPSSRGMSGARHFHPASCQAQSDLFGHISANIKVRATKRTPRCRYTRGLSKHVSQCGSLNYLIGEKKSAKVVNELQPTIHTCEIIHVAITDTETGDTPSCRQEDLPSDGISAVSVA